MNGIRPLIQALRTPVALGYLLIVAGVAVWAGADALLVDHADASLAAIWAFLVTAPTSLLFVMLPGPLAWTGIAIGAVAQAAVLGAAYRGLSGRFTRHAGPRGA